MKEREIKDVNVTPNFDSWQNDARFKGLFIQLVDLQDGRSLMCFMSREEKH